MQPRFSRTDPAYREARRHVPCTFLPETDGEAIMPLQQRIRQVIGAAIGAAIAAVVSLALSLPAAERHERLFDTAEQTPPAANTPQGALQSGSSVVFLIHSMAKVALTSARSIREIRSR